MSAALLWPFGSKSSKHNVPLVDEYDPMYFDLAPMWGIPAAELRESNLQVQQKKDTFTLHVKDGKLTSSRTYGKKDYGRAMADLKEQFAVLKSAAGYLPGLNVTYSIHDTAHTFISWEHRQALIHGKPYQGKPWKGLALACPPGTNAVTGNVPRRQHSFITSIPHAVDVCLHPDFIALHGATAKKEPRGDGKIPPPIFTVSKTNVHFDPQGASPSQWKDPKKAPYLPWDRKHKRRALWRGSGSGTYNSNDWPWMETPRFRLVNLTTTWGDKVDILAPWVGKRGLDRLTLDRDAASEMLFDFHFANEFAKAVRECLLSSVLD